MTKKIITTLIAAFALALVGSVAALSQAQAGTGQITGVISDSTGAVVPNATVTLTSKATNQSQTTTTSEDGIYRFVLLQPGIYVVKAAAASFAAQTVDVEVQVGRATD